MKSLQEHLFDTLVLEKYTPEEQDEMAAGIIGFFTQQFKSVLDNLPSIANEKNFYSVHAYLQDGTRWDWDWLSLPNNAKSQAFKLIKEYIEFVYNQLVNATIKDIKTEVLNKDGAKKWSSYDLFTPRFSKSLIKKYEELEKEMKGLWGDLEKKLEAGDAALKDTNSMSRNEGNPRVPMFMHYIIEYMNSMYEYEHKDIVISSGYLKTSVNFNKDKKYINFGVEHHPEPQNMVQGELPHGLKDAFGTEIAVDDLVLWKDSYLGFTISHVKGAAGKYVVLDKFINKDFLHAMPASLVVLKSQGQPVDFEKFVSTK